MNLKNQKEILTVLDNKIQDIVFKTNWQPEDCSTDDIIRFIELKAMFITAGFKIKKLQKENKDD